jgi:hypothetical protein
MLRYSTRELALVILAVGLSLGWWLDRSALSAAKLEAAEDARALAFLSDPDWTLCGPDAFILTTLREKYGNKSETAQGDLRFRVNGHSNTQQVTPTVIMSNEDLVAIANARFGRAHDAACIVEDRGRLLFVAPPAKRRHDVERLGVYLDKTTGAIVDAPK